MKKILVAAVLLASVLPALAHDLAPGAKITATACPAGQHSVQVYEIVSGAAVRFNRVASGRAENTCPKEWPKACWILTSICTMDKPQ